jgi:hypothetical protein
MRDGLSNEQIALRLNFPFDGPKFHVSDISRRRRLSGTFSKSPVGFLPYSPDAKREARPRGASHLTEPVATGC